MSNGFSQNATKASLALFEGLFIIAALVAVFATFIAISGVDPDRPSSGATPYLLAANALVIVALAIIVSREYLAIRGPGGAEYEGRLAKRFVLLFGFSALVPAMIVAIFVGAVITRGLDSWLGERVETVMEQNASIFQENLDRLERTFEVDVRLAALDIETFARNVGSGGLSTTDFSSSNEEVTQIFRDGLQSTLAYRELLTIAILGADGVEFVAEESVQEPVLVPPPSAAFEEADGGGVGMTLYENRGISTAIIRISEPVDGYVYAVKAFDQNLLSMLREAQGQLVLYNNAKERSGRLQNIFLIGYAQIVALILLLASRLGLEAAGRITGPIGRLASAAHSVRDGDLSVRVPVDGPKDEVRALAHSFNTMTSQLSAQRTELITARREEEERRKFIETLLGEVSAGVMQITPDLTVLIANPSANALLARDHIARDAPLAAVAPQFVPVAEQVVKNREPVDTSLDLDVGGEIKNVRLKAATDANGGCVLTFDDTTRLVNAQRQMAWRDVARRIAHEIRNPLTPIMLSTERINRRYGKLIDDSDGVFEKCIDTILRQVGDIGRMVEEFSSFARMPKPNMSEFDLVSLLRSVSFSQSVVSPDIGFDFDTDLFDASLTGDERLLAQAFGNLLKNAAEAIEGQQDQGDVPASIQVRLQQVNNEYEIIIEDNGPGFPEQVRDKLLEPYVTTREKGTGLGLAIVNRIILDHSGSIALQNRQDGLQGARVRVRLPARAYTEDLKNKTVDHSKETNSRHVEETS